MEEEACATSQEEAKKDESSQVRSKYSTNMKLAYTNNIIANKPLAPPTTIFRSQNVKFRIVTRPDKLGIEGRIGYLTMQPSPPKSKAREIGKLRQF